MPVLKNPRHEQFAQGVFSGLTAVEAYMNAYSCSRENAERNATRFTENEGICGRISELNGETAKLACYEKADCIRDLVAMIQAEPVTAGPKNRLSNLYMSKAGPYFALPDKLAAMARLAKMLGWDEADKLEATLKGDPFTAWLKKERKRQ
jgi:hypothetical protein